MRFITGQAGTSPATDMGGSRKEQTAMTTSNGNRKVSVALWTIQGLLAVVFLGAGISKLVLPIEDLTRDVAYPELFIRFIGVC